MTLRFKKPYHMGSDWTTEGSSITASENLERIRRELEDRGSVILEHRHYDGARAPSRLVFDDYDELCRYLEKEAIAGDSLWLWAFEDVCTVDRVLVQGKCPADDGTVPRGGAY